MSAQARQMVNGPATGLLVTAGLGIAIQVLGILLNLLGVGVGAAEGGDQAAMAMFNGAFGIATSLFAIAVGGFIWWGAGKMKSLESYGLAIATSVIAMVPCVSPCCIVGLPIGIWALVVLMKPEVKEAFTG